MGSQDEPIAPDLIVDVKEKNLHQVTRGLISNFFPFGVLKNIYN